MLFISGQGPKNYEADIEAQIRETFEQIRSIVEAAGGGMGNITMIRAYFLNMARDLAAFRKVRQEFLVEPYPAATAVGVTELAVPGLQVEIEARRVKKLSRTLIADQSVTYALLHSPISAS